MKEIRNRHEEWLHDNEYSQLEIMKNTPIAEINWNTKKYTSSFVFDPFVVTGSLRFEFLSHFSCQSGHIEVKKGQTDKVKLSPLK